jgi:hypothetical protein
MRPLGVQTLAIAYRTGERPLHHDWTILSRDAKQVDPSS